LLQNEVEKAIELRDKYFLYLVDRSKITDVNYEPREFKTLIERFSRANFGKRKQALENNI
jgi:hypothetical protein